MNADLALNRTEINEITERVIGCLYKVSNTIGAGFLVNFYKPKVEIKRLVASQAWLRI